MTEKNKDHLKEILISHKKDLSDILGAIANDSRIQIMASLINNSKEFSELKEIVGLSKTALAHHLERLTSADLLKNISRGRYELTSDGEELLLSIASSYADSQRKRESEAKILSEKMTKAFSKKDDSYEHLRVHFERLTPMRVVSFHAYSKSPERDASLKMNEWARANGILINKETHPTFGFDNPSPTRGKEEYGYEFWLKIDDDFETDDDIKIIDIPERLYAVTTSWRLADVGRDWKNLDRWLKEHDYEIIKNIPCLERAHLINVSEDELVLDLLVPLKE